MNDDYDVVVVGGGIHGAGAAQAAAAAGYRTLVLEQTGIAAGTSSRSSKLIHGGLRYLESAQIGLIRESLREREILLRIAPDLVHLTPFFIPVYATTSRRPWQMRAGLSIYALLGGLGSNRRFRSLPRRQWDRLDGLSTRGLQAVYQYWDAQTDDAALTRAVMRSAQSLGAELACPARFESARLAGNRYEIGFSEEGAARSCRSRALINAAGPWVNQVQAAISPAPARHPVELVQGAHVEIEGEIRWGIYYVESPRDRRAVFVMPWKDRILVGTTETVYKGDPARVQPLAEEVEYLQETLTHYFPDQRAKFLDSFAGLRVLPAGKGRIFNRSRETILAQDGELPGLIAIYGGKLTGYRATAVKVMRALRRWLPEPKEGIDTARLPLSSDTPV